MKLSKEEQAEFDKAFLASKAKTVKERDAAGMLAVEAMRGAAKLPKPAHVGLTGKMKNRPKTLMDAVDQGIEDGSN